MIYSLAASVLNPLFHSVKMSFPYEENLYDSDKAIMKKYMNDNIVNLLLKETSYKPETFCEIYTHLNSKDKEFIENLIYISIKEECEGDYVDVSRHLENALDEFGIIITTIDKILEKKTNKKNIVSKIMLFDICSITTSVQELKKTAAILAFLFADM